jgi:hypothetical protein
MLTIPPSEMRKDDQDQADSVPDQEQPDPVQLAKQRQGNDLVRDANDYAGDARGENDKATDKVRHTMPATPEVPLVNFCVHDAASDIRS